MSLFFGSAQTRSIDSLPWSVGSPGSLLGASLSSALRLIPVYAATSLIADSIATLPLRAYRDLGDGVRDRVPVQPRLVTGPQLHGSLIDWLHQALISLLLRGNAFGLVVQWASNGWPARIVWLHPDKVHVDENGSAPVYRYNGRELDSGSVVHIAGYVIPGSVVGLSPIGQFRLQLSKGMSAQEFATSFFDRGVAPAGVLSNTKKTVTTTEADIAKQRFKTAVAARDIFVTGHDWQWNALTVSAADATFLEAIEASATEVAAIFRVAPEDIGGKTGHSRTYSTLVMEMQKLAQRTLLPWTARMEAALTALMPAPHYAKFSLDAIARAELKTRMETHKLALEIGLETFEEARALEEKPPLTPEQIAAWQNLHGPGRKASEPPSKGTGP